MTDLFATGGVECIELPDADLRLWRDVELGAPAARLLDDLLAECELVQGRGSR